MKRRNFLKLLSLTTIVPASFLCAPKAQVMRCQLISRGVLSKDECTYLGCKSGHFVSVRTTDGHFRLIAFLDNGKRYLFKSSKFGYGDYREITDVNHKWVNGPPRCQIEENNKIVYPFFNEIDIFYRYV